MSKRYPGDEPGPAYPYSSWPGDGEQPDPEDWDGQEPGTWAADPRDGTGPHEEPGPPKFIGDQASVLAYSLDQSNVFHRIHHLIWTNAGFPVSP